MSRFPDEASRLVYRIGAGGVLVSAAGSPAVVYSDPAGTVQLGSPLTVDAGSGLPEFFADADVVYVRVKGGPPQPVYADRSERLDALEAAPAATLAPVTIGWRAGMWYGVRSWMAHGTLTGQALTANQVFAAPVYVPADVTVTSIACNVTAGVAGASLRMGIYAIRPDGRPDALVAGSDGGVIAAVTAGDKAATIAAALTGGRWYYLAVLSDQAISVNGFTGSQPNPLGTTGPSSSNRSSGVRASIAAGWSAMPAVFPANPTVTAITLTTEVTF